MSQKPIDLKKFIILTPLIAVFLFVLLFTLAAFTYPGGSWQMPHQEGFNFWHNYLCDLLDEYAVNGELNSASYFARASLFILCIGLLLLWNWLPSLFNTKNLNLRIVKISGILAFTITLFLTSGTHDITIRIAGFFGAIALVGFLIELFKSSYRLLFYLGICCLLTFLVNYYVYETGLWIQSLPIIQKVTFLLFLVWFLLLNLTLYKSHKC